MVKKGSVDEEIKDMKILRSLMKYLWLKDNVEFRMRVLLALGLLVGAKVRIMFNLEGSRRLSMNMCLYCFFFLKVHLLTKFQSSIKFY